MVINGHRTYRDYREVAGEGYFITSSDNTNSLSLVAESGQEYVVNTPTIDHIISIVKRELGQIDDPLRKCAHCGQWGAVHCACKHCGAPID